VLHIWDQAGVAFILAKFQQANGNESKVIRIKNADKYGIDEFYKEYGLFVAPEDLIYKSIEEARKADIIHIHSLPEMVINIRKIYGRSKIIILHYHGTDIRGFPKDNSRTFNLGNILKPKNIVKKIKKRRLHIKAQRLADRVIVSTPDLIQLVKGSVFLPNPIDTDHFNNKKLTKERSVDISKGVIVNSEVTNIELAMNYFEHKKIDLNIDIYDRTKNPIYYKDVPNFLKKYDVYVDLRFVNRKLLKNLSKTALEALACGLRVLNYKLEYMNNLPSEHCPTNVVTILSSIYSHKRDRPELIKLELELAILNIIYGVHILLRKLLKYK
jgi:glycosyltransferase involved in cell wall biosynthesis